MATIQYWIQLENRPWDACPNSNNDTNHPLSDRVSVDRISGRPISVNPGEDPTNSITGKERVEVSLQPVGGGPSVTRRMFGPLRDSDGKVTDALILRRYKPPQKQDQSDAWTIPDDRKVNPWDLNEPDPTDNGTMGTIPGPVIECNVGDSVVVHFRNNDRRTQLGTEEICFPFPFLGEICFPIKVPVPIPIEQRCHSLHPHGFVFKATSDGAYPLSRPAAGTDGDPAQPVGVNERGEDETPLWASVPKFSGTFKLGDRVPPGGTFTYHWNTFGWPTTAGVWLYHDHSICDMDNVELGAIGVIVIHNPANTDEEVDIRAGDPSDPSKLDPAFLPSGDANGSPVQTICFPVPPFPGHLPFRELRLLPGDLEGLGASLETGEEHGTGGMPMRKMAKASKPKHTKVTAGEHEVGPPVVARTIRRGNLLLELDEKFTIARRFCLPHYRTPPTKGLYLQLFHTLTGAAGMCINGRTFLGNTPTIVAGTNTRMRFGVVGMGSLFHTFHIHGHRWVIPGPHGNAPGAIQGSVMDTPVSQFEDTRVFGPANSFVFTVPAQSGSFMRAGGPGPADSIGEWHMHCHVLQHMGTGMMGSLLIVNGGELAFGLPTGVPCPTEMPAGGGMGNGGMPGTKKIDAKNVAQNINPTGFAFDPLTQSVNKGDSVIFTNSSNDSHMIIWDSPNAPATVPTYGPGGQSAPVVMSNTGTFNYHCGIHGTQMKGTIIVT